MENPKLQKLLQQLDEQRDAYNESHRLLRELLAEKGEDQRTLVPESSSTQSSDLDPHPRKTSTTTVGLDSVLTSSASRATGEDTDSEGEEEYYVQTPLPHQEYDHEGLRGHLRSYAWTIEGRKVLGEVVNDPEYLKRPNLFPTRNGPTPDRSHLSHHQVFDVGADGAPMVIEIPESERPPSNALLIWNTIKELNSPSKGRNAVGRISVVHEISPVLFGAIHYTMHKDFDVDGLFKHLADTEPCSASLKRAFDTDERRRRSFVFSFEYFTILDEGCKPQPWQLLDRQEDRSPSHIPITRCSSVVALSLGGKPIKRIRNRSRLAKGSYGSVYDPFAPWQVLNIQFYPDWRSSVDIHDSTKHYVNGVEAFMVTILGEFKDAHNRFEAIFHKISRLVTPPLDFVFNPDVRERLLFEDASFTYTRRYFWAAQTLGIVNDSIRAMIDAYEDNFVDEVWLGTHKAVWPLDEEDSPRNLYFKKKMAALRQKFDAEVLRLRNLVIEIDDRRDEIKSLREELFVGTSIQESRKSVENSDITVLQGHNIKILTLVSIFFLPLTFVTSVFGMTNMPSDPVYWSFATVTVCVCVPFFLLVGSLNTTKGLHFWRQRTKTALKAIGNFLAWASGLGRPRNASEEEKKDEHDDDIILVRPLARQPTYSRKERRSTRKRPPNVAIPPRNAAGGAGVEVERTGVQKVITDEDRSPPLSGTPSQLSSMMRNEFKRKRTVSYSDEVKKIP